MGIVSFVKQVLESHTNKKQVFSLGTVTDKNAEIIKSATGLDVKDYERIVDNYAIKHIIAGHGNKKTESNRGQIAVNKSDFKKIDEITNSSDIITTVENKPDLLVYQKRINELLFYVEEKRDGKKQLAAKTMYKRK